MKFKLTKNMVARLLMVSLSCGVLVETVSSHAQSAGAVTPAVGDKCASAAACSNNLVCDLTSSSCQVCIPGSSNPKGGDFGCSYNSQSDINNCCGVWGCDNINSSGLGTCGPLLNEGTTEHIITAVVFLALAVWSTYRYLYIVTEDPVSGENSLVATGFTDQNIVSADSITGLGFVGESLAEKLAASAAVGARGTGTTYVPLTGAGRVPVAAPVPVGVAQAATVIQQAASGSGSGSATAAVKAATQAYIAGTLVPKAKAALSSYRNMASIKDALINDRSGNFAKLLLAQSICTDSDADNFVKAIQETATSSDFGVVFTDAALDSAKQAQPGALLDALFSSSFIQSISIDKQSNLTPTRIANNVRIAQAYDASDNTKALHLIESLGGFSFNEIDFQNISPAEANLIGTGVARVQQIFTGAGFSTDGSGFPLDSSLTFFGEA